MPKRGARRDRRPLEGGLGDALPATKIPLVELPVFGTIAPMATVEPGPRNCPVTGFMRLTVGAGARVDAVRTARHVEQRRRAGAHSSGRKLDACPLVVVLRLLVHEPHAVVQRQPVGHLPVVLDVGLVVGVDDTAPRRTSTPACRS